MSAVNLTSINPDTTLSTSPNANSESGETPSALMSAASSNTKSVNSLWKFGSSELRIGSDGLIRDATDEEILAETRSSPAAMVKLLGAGADLLRFDANGQYSEDVKRIAEIQAQEGKTPQEISAEAQAAVEDLRTKMRADISSGVFTVNDSGQVFHNGQAIPQESVGFELNALLIESLTDKVGELNALSSQLLAVDQYIQELDNYNDASVILLADRSEKVRVQNGVLINYTYTTEYGNEFDEFVANNSTFAQIEEVANVSDPAKMGDTLMDVMESDYQLLLEGSGLVTTSWLKPIPDDGDYRRVTSGSSLNQQPGYEGYPNGFLTISEKYINQYTINRTALTEAKENIRSRSATLATISEQLGTNFTVDNSRFNSIVEAMNNYNKSVLDSLKRFSVI